MKTVFRVLSLLLALLMLSASFVACDGGDDTQDDTTANTNVGDSGIELPQIDWEGEEYRILGRYQGSHISDNVEIAYEEIPDDVVGKEVWERNMALKEKYNFVVVGTLVSNPHSTIKNSLDSGEDLYDLFLAPPSGMQTYALEGKLVDLNELMYLNFEHDTWNTYANEQLTMGGKLYYTTNKFVLQDKNRTPCLYYNREMVVEQKIGLIEPLVFEGTWTFEEMVQMCKQVSRESDGVDGITIDDTFGFAMQGDAWAERLAYGVGFRLSENGNDGYPTFVGATDRCIALLDEVYKLMGDRTILYCDPSPADPNYNADHVFWQERAIFNFQTTSALTGTKTKVDFVFGVLPLPKYDVSQEDYYTTPDLSLGSLLAVPVTVTDLSKVGFFLEAISEEAVDTSYNAYIETKSKLQDAYDEDVARCLDILFDGVVYDIVYITDMGSLKSILQQSAVYGGSTFATKSARYIKMAEKSLEEIKTAYSAR